jgi:outer membrane receptor protein involved in Fe transport
MISGVLRLLRHAYPAGVCSLAVLLAAGTASAQRTTGDIVGTVTDDTGAVLVGVTVDLSGQHIAGTQTSVTNQKGVYRFVNLPPGSYDLTFSLQGFGTLRRPAMRVSVGATIEVNVSLKLGQFAEAVTVTGETPIVDTKSTKVGTNYDDEWVRNAPINRSDFFDLINAAPSVSASSTGNVQGSGSDENTYLLDGTDLTAPFTGAAWPWPNADTIHEIEIISLGAPAEYGNASGAVFNIVTRQGSNTWRGEAAYYGQYDSLTGRNTTEEQDDGLPFHRNEYIDFTALFSFPVVKDKLWFLGTYQYRKTSAAQPGVDPTTVATGKVEEFLVKANWQINNNHKIMGSVFNDIYFDPSPQDANEAATTVGAENGHNPTVNLTYTGILSADTYVEARFSGFYGYDHRDPTVEGFPRVAPRFYNLDTGEVTGGLYFWYDNFAYRNGVTGKVSHYADDFLGGSHDFKFGVQWFSGGSKDGVIGINDFIYIYEYYGNQYGYGYHYSSPYTYGATTDAIGAFVDDSFLVNDSLTLNLGVRYDHQKGSIPDLVDIDPSQTEAVAGGADPTGEIISGYDVATWSVVSPRVGFNLKLTEDGRTALKAHYGLYYRMMLTGEFTYSLGVSPTELFAGPYDLETNQFTELTKIYETATNFGVNPNYSNPYTHQFIVSFDRELGPNVGLSATYTHKRGRENPAWHDITGVYQDAVYIDDQGAEATGQPIEVLRLVSDPDERFFEIDNDARMKTTINGFTVQLTKRWTDNWSLTGSFNYLRATGALPSGRGSTTSNQAASLIFSDFGRNPNDFVNNEGRLTGERPVAAKAQFLYEWPYGILLGLNYIYQSGRPWTRRVRVTDVTDIFTEINAEPIDGDRRVASWNSLDLRLQKSFSLSTEASFLIFGDLLNVFNEDTNQNVLSRLGTSESYAFPSAFIPPRRLMIGAKFQFN